MLVDAVRELDETSMWDSWSKERGELDGFGFKEKVASMAMEKGDCGKVAFLESVGMNLSSAMNVARYLSGEMLPSLIYKVGHYFCLLFNVHSFRTNPVFFFFFFFELNIQGCSVSGNL